MLQLKNEHGGLQTLLRNHCHIFKGLLNFNKNNNNNNGLFTAYPQKRCGSSSVKAFNTKYLMLRTKIIIIIIIIKTKL